MKKTIEIHIAIDLDDDDLPFNMEDLKHELQLIVDDYGVGSIDIFEP